MVPLTSLSKSELESYTYFIMVRCLDSLCVITISSIYEKIAKSLNVWELDKIVCIINIFMTRLDWKV